MVVDQIIDIVEEETYATQLSSRAGAARLRGGRPEGDRLPRFACGVEAARQSWYDGESAEETHNGSILLIDQSGFSRGLVRSYLEMAGHNVVEANGADEALEKLDCNHIDLAIVSANLPGNGAVLEQIRKKTNETHIPVMGLADDRGDTSSEAARKYDSYHFKSERQAILDAVSKLISGETRPVPSRNSFAVR